MKKQIMKKELKLCLYGQSLVFAIIGGLCVLIPNWPIAVAFIYVLSGISVIFPRALANRDIEYSLILPIKKSDVVFGKLFVGVFIELLAMAIGAVCALLKLYVFKFLPGEGEDVYNSVIAPNFSVFGLALVAFSIHNLILYPWYYKDPLKKLTAPQLVSLFGAMFLLGAAQGGSCFVNLIQDPTLKLIIDLSVFAAGIVISILLTWITYILSAKNFEKVSI
jgi:hypothetical protein